MQKRERWIIKMYADNRRSLIFSGKVEDIDKLLNIIPKWTCNEVDIDGKRKCIENRDLNVRVFLDSSGTFGLQSGAVAPIDSSGDIDNKYEEGYDASKNQKSDIKDDILYSLCLQINKAVNEYNESTEDIENKINVLCGIVPGYVDIEMAGIE